MDTKEIFSIRLNELIQERKEIDNTFQKKVLSTELHVTPQTVSRWCNGQILPNDSMLSVVAAYFSVSMDYLKGLTDFRNETNHDPFYMKKLDSEEVQGNAVIALLESLGYSLRFETINRGGLKKKVASKHCRELVLNREFLCYITAPSGEIKVISETEWNLFKRELLRYTNYVISDLLKER